MSRNPYPFEPTHILEHDGMRIPVQHVSVDEYEGRAYTEAQWATQETVTYTTDQHGNWLHNGKPFTGAVHRA